MNNKYYSAKILLQYGCCNGEVEAKVDDYEAVVIIYDCTKSVCEEFCVKSTVIVMLL